MFIVAAELSLHVRYIGVVAGVVAAFVIVLVVMVVMVRVDL